MLAKNRSISIKAKLTLSFGLLTVLVLLVVSAVADEQRTDQVQRDLTRILSEVFQRAHSHKVLGEVARPEFASPNISLRVPNLSEGWVPSCEIEIEASSTDPRDHLQSLVLVPRDRITHKGTVFSAFVFYVGEPVVTSEIFEVRPDWLSGELGGYASLESDLDLLMSRSDIVVKTTICSDFSYSIVEGTPK